MRKVFIAISVLMLTSGALVIEAARHTDTVRVQVHKEKRFPRSKMSVRFIELMEDSRCPVDVNCVWAGNAKIKVRISKNRHSEVVTLETNGSDKSVNFEGHTIRLVELTPKPRSNVRIDRNGYIATLEVSH